MPMVAPIMRAVLRSPDAVLRLFAGLLRPTHGEILFNDQPIIAPKRERAFIFQDYGRALLPWRTVWANVALVFERQHMLRGERRERAYTLLRRILSRAIVW